MQSQTRLLRSSTTGSKNTKFLTLPNTVTYTIAPFPVQAGFDGELSDLIRATPIWRERDELLRSVPGVGTVLSVTSWLICQSWEP
jgi:hypothetical protein